MTENMALFYVYALGIVYLITEASVFAIVRLAVWRVLGRVIAGVYCRACVGFWVGVVCSLCMPGALPGATIGQSAIFGGLSTMLLGVLWTAQYGSAFAWSIEAEALALVTEKLDPHPKGMEDTDDDR